MRHCHHIPSFSPEPAIHPFQPSSQEHFGKNDPYLKRCWSKDLYDAILIKDNHIAIAGSISNALNKVKKLKNKIKIEIEVDNLKQFKEALKFNPDVIMLDNFKINDLKKAVKMAKNKVILEASGKIDHSNVAKIAESGVDFISSGWITHSSKSLDIGLDLIK